MKNNLSAPKEGRSRGLKGARWFEKNPKKSLFFLVLVFFSLTLVGAEKILSLKSNIKNEGIKRYIKLREYPPFYTAKFIPTEDDMALSDSLVRKEYLFRIDGNGFVMPSKIHDKPDLSIVFLGGSTTACHYVEEENRFPYLAGRLLEKQAGLKVNSFNSGVGGNYSLHSINILVNKVIPLKPDIVVMLHNINDLAILMNAKSYYNNTFKKGATANIVEFKPPALTARGIALFPNVYRGLRDLEKHVRRSLYPNKPVMARKDETQNLARQKITLDQPAILKEFEMSLQTFIYICRARNIIPVLMTMENRLKEAPDPLIKKLNTPGLTYAAYKEMFDRFNQAIRDLGARNQVLVIDLGRQVPQEKEYMYDLVHFTDRGSRLAAQIISAGLRPVVEKIARAKQP
jgi:hypothetical protein